MTDQNIGRFSIPIEDVRCRPDMVSQVFRLMGFVPVRAESLFHDSIIEYVGMSDLFKAVEKGGRLIEYELTITTNKNGTVERVTANEIK